MSEHARYTLLTNISCVAHKGIRLRVSAIVIACDASDQGPIPQRQQVRMFGPSSAWPICDVDVPLASYSLTERPLPADFPKGHRPVWRTYDLSFREPNNPLEPLKARLSPQTFEITTSLMEDQPINVLEFPAGTSITEVWEGLEAGVIHAWHAPYFPTLAWESIESVAVVTARR